MIYKIDIIFDGDDDKQLKTVTSSSFLDVIKKTEEFFNMHLNSSPEILSATIQDGKDTHDIKLKIIHTLNERRN